MLKDALYYPEWRISDPLFMAEVLLYWDRLKRQGVRSSFFTFIKNEDLAYFRVIDVGKESEPLGRNSQSLPNICLLSVLEWLLEWRDGKKRVQEKDCAIC